MPTTCPLSLFPAGPGPPPTSPLIDMGTIGGLGLAPISINNKGQATGTYTTTAGINRAFLWQDGVATDLGTLPGGVSAEGGLINDRGQITGQSCSETSCSVFLWRNGVMTDLNAVVPADSSLSIFAATAINSRGEIAGVAFDSGACCHAFLAIPDNGAVTENATAPAQSEATQRPKLVLPENVRKTPQQRRGFGRLLGPAIRPSTD